MSVRQDLDRSRPEDRGVGLDVRRMYRWRWLKSPVGLVSEVVV